MAVGLGQPSRVLEFLDRVGHDELGLPAPPNRERTCK
jgi:hypothetical protein